MQIFLSYRQITDLVAHNAVVQQAIDAVNEEGQYQAIKYLFEIIGLYPASAADECPVEDSLAKRFCSTWARKRGHRSQCS